MAFYGQATRPAQEWGYPGPSWGGTYEGLLRLPLVQKQGYYGPGAGLPPSFTDYDPAMPAYYGGPDLYMQGPGWTQATPIAPPLYDDMAARLQQFDQRYQGSPVPGAPPGITYPPGTPPGMSPAVHGAPIRRGGALTAATGGIPPGIPPGVDPEWYAAFQREHGMKPEQYYAPTSGGDPRVALGQALKDKEWGESYYARHGFAPGPADWDEWFYQKQQMGWGF